MTKVSCSVASLKNFYKDKETLPDPTEVIQELISTSDRALVITLGAFLDDALEHRLSKAMRPLEKEEYREAFRFDGPLGSFSAKIEMCYLLKLIEEDRRSQMHDIREMRNACANSKRPISFKNTELANVARRVVKASHFKSAPLRSAFILECFFQFTSLVLSEEQSLENFRKAVERGGDEHMKASLKKLP
jgi:hypothetical protein